MAKWRDMLGDQSWWRLAALFGGGPVIVGLLIWTIWIIAYDPWHVWSELARVQGLTWVALSLCALIGIVFAAIASLHVRGSGPGGIGFEIDSRPEGPRVTTTVETHVEPPPAVNKDGSHG